MAEYKLEEYDIQMLREAKRQIMKVYNYHYGARRSGPVIRRIETVLNKLDALMDGAPGSSRPTEGGGGDV